MREHGSYYATGTPGTSLSTATDRQDVPNQTRLVYDGADRVTASIFQPYTTERWRTTTAYGGDRVDVTPPSGGTVSSTVTDALGRTTALREYHGSTPTGAYDNTTYTFDRKSQLKKVTDPAGNHWDYTYDLRGRQLTASDPDKGTVTSTYDTAGRVYQTFGYELETGRLVNTRTDREAVAPYTVTNTTYAYDKAGNITGTSDAATGDNQCFQYDYLRRLTEAWTPAVDDGCKTAASTAGLGGPAPYWQSWTYDLTGNRLSQVDHATSTGGANTTTTYTYPAAGSSRPHAVTGTTATTGSLSVTSGYTYDNSGNTVTRPTKAGNAQTLTWDPEGHLASTSDSSGTTSYLYDADGNRLISHDQGGTTLFLPGQEVRYTTATGATTCTRYYAFGNETIASRTAKGVMWLSSDHQGTALTAIDRETQTATVRRQTPFGTPRGTSATPWPNDRGFVGGVVDNTGLTHLGAREYDPGIGRFISVDPVQDLNDPQQWNAYTYAGNNPVTMSDPSGLCFTDACISHQLHLDDRDQPAKSSQGNGGSTTDPDTEAAQKHVDQAKQRVVTVAKAILKIAMDIVGVTSALDCFTTGDLGSCIDTGLNVLMSFVGGLAGKIVAKYAFRFRAAYRLGKQLKNLATELIDGVREWRGARKALDEAKTVAKDCNSFAPGTPVLLANGSSKPIEKIKLGDLVVTTDPESGKTATRVVTRLITGEGQKDLVRITVDTDGSRGHQTGTVVATAHHPFWVPQLHRWVNATDLHAGTWLQTSAGTWVQITAVTRWAEHARVHNLTIDDLHTYYVLAGNTPVLVHNDWGIGSRIDSYLVTSTEIRSRIASTLIPS